MFDGYVLVGGKSSRMGSDKAALRLGVKSFAARAADTLQKIAPSRVRFVLSANRTAEATNFFPPGIPQIIDVFPNKAALGAIYTALADAENEWAAILACDNPFVTTDLLVRLAEIAASVESSVSAIAPVQPDGLVQPLCALYRVEPSLAAAGQLLKSDRVPPVSRLLGNTQTHFVPFDELADLAGAEYFFANVNTPEDYVRAQDIYRRLQNLI